MLKVKIVLGILILIGIIVIYFRIPYSPYKMNFDNKMKKRIKTINSEVKKSSKYKKNLCTKDEISKLPALLQKHCEFINLEGMPKYNAVNVKYSNTRFVFNSENNTVLDMDYDLWLFSERIFRSAYCKSYIKGIPFDGIDYCNDNKEGGMKGILGKSIPIFNIHNKQMYRAALISWLAEGVGVNPSIILSPYVTYEQIDEKHIKAVVSYNGVSGGGIFSFNDDGVITKFESYERQEEKVNGIMTSIGWRAEYDNFITLNNVKIPKIMRAVKIYDDKEIVYFDSKDNEIIYYK